MQVKFRTGTVWTITVLGFDSQQGLHHHVQTSSGAHPVSYPMGIRDSFHGDKAAGA